MATTTLPLMSRSALEARICGHRYNKLYNEGMTDESEFSLRGTAYHKVKRRYVLRLAAANLPMDNEEAQLAFAEGIAEAKTPPQLVQEVREIFERHVQHFELDLEAFAAAEDRRQRTDAAVPYEFTPDLEYIHFDRNEVEIIDDKSYFVGFSEAQAERQIQTRYYIWAAMQEYPGFDTYRFTYNFVRINQFVSVVFDKDDFDMLDREVRAMEGERRARHESGDWKANPGDACAFCHLTCPVMDDPRRQAVRVNSDESFEVVAGAVIVAEKYLKEMKKSLRSYCVANGPQDVNGEVFGIRDLIKRSYSVAAVVDLFRSFNLSTLATMGASALKKDLKLAGENERLRLGLLALETQKRSTKFEHKSLKSDAASDWSADDDEE